MMRLLLLVALASLQACAGVSLYEYYVPGGVVSSGLVAEGPTFNLNGKDMTILSGSFHYFRIHPDYWRDTLQKMRAAGLNTVQLYVPWNKHEPRQGEYDFGQLGEDMSAFLDVRSFIQMAQEEDLFVLFRPGPYICSEWDFGGLPSWLLRDPTMHVRTYYDNYRNAVEAYFNILLPLVADLQFTTGGPIIGVQIENEYGNFGWDDEPRDHLYLDFIKDNIESNGYTDTLLFTSDSQARTYDWGALRGVLQMANFREEAEANLSVLKQLQPNRPMMVDEFWTGWFDHWLADIHQTWNVEDFAATLEYILSQNSSVNMYMFIGGTNFGFMAGANSLPVAPFYGPIVTSYDYGAPLSEAGDYTEKYQRAVDIMAAHNPLQGIVDNPVAPPQRTKAAYGNWSVTDALDFPSIVAQAPESFNSLTGPVNMEALPMNNNSGQSYGYLLYTASVAIPAPQATLMIRGHVRDMAQVLVNGELVTPQYGGLNDLDSFGYWNGRDKSLNLTGDGTVSSIDILVENLGRVNYGSPNQFVQKKGLWEGDILLGRTIIEEWTMTPLEFTKSFVNGLTGWQGFSGSLMVPSMYRTVWTLASSPEDTFLDMQAWGKGVVFLNGFNLGRYWSVGPTRTLYIPAPLLTQGDNEVIVFEQYEPANEISFIDYPILE